MLRNMGCLKFTIRTLLFSSVCVFGLLLSIDPAFAATYYVDNENGANSNDGSLDHPWKECPGTQNPTTPTGGWATLQAGDTIVLTAGQIWTKGVKIDSGYYNNGAPNSPITITSSAEPERAVFDFSAGGSTGFDIIRDYITVKHLEIRNITASDSRAIRIGQSVSDPSVGVKVLYCYIHEIEDPVVLTCSGETEQYAYGIELQNRSGTEIAYNIIKNVNKKWIS